MATYGQLKDALLKAHGAGDTQAAELFARKMRDKDYDEESSGVASAAQGIAQGATFGFSDEIGAGARAGLGEFFDKNLGSLLYASGTGVDFAEDDERGFFEKFRDYRKGAEDERGIGERYNQALESQRGALETARREDPWTTGIGELAGGLSSGGVGMARSLAGRSLLQGARAGAGAGAKLGAVAGYGYSEGDVLAAALQEVVPGGAGTGNYDRALSELKEAAGGAALGATLGGAVGGALPLLGAAIRKTGELITRPFTKDARINEVGRRQIMDLLEQDIADGNMTMAEAKKLLRETPGMSIADLSPRLQDLTETLAQTATAGGRRIRDTLTERAAGQYNRIMPKLSEGLGAEGRKANFHQYAKQLQEQAAKAGDEAFGLAYRTPIEMSRSMYNVLTKTNTGKAGLRLANDLAREMQKKLPGIGKPGTMNSTERMHLILQGMDDHVDDMFRNGTPKVARAARDVRDAFREEVLGKNEGLRAARQVWGGHMEAKDALNNGRRIFTDEFELTAQTLESMSEGAKTHFRIGVLQEIGSRMSRKIDTADMTRELLKKRSSREAIRVAFGDEKKFQQFMQVLENEARMQKTFELAVGNSATGRRLAQASTDTGEKLAALAGYGISLSTGIGLPPSIGGFLARRGYQATGAPGRAAEQYGRVVGNQADTLLGADIGALAQPNRMGGLLGVGVPGSAAGAAGTLLASGQPQGLLGMK